MIENLGKGCLPDGEDTRDFLAAPLMGASQVDWTKEFRLPEPPNSNQANADCCVGEAWSYYHWQITGHLFAVRSVFAYIAQSYGANIRDGGLRVIKYGQELFATVPDPNPKTPANMRDKTGLSEAEARKYIEANSFVVPYSMDGIAWGIQNYKGVVGGLQGTNEGWQNLLVPEPPKAGDAEIVGKLWGHALYFFGFHTHTNPDGSHERCLIAKSSWCQPGLPTEHHIRERYFNTGNVFSAWTLIPKGNSEPMKLLNVNGTIYLVGDKGAFGIADPESLAEVQQLSSAPIENGTLTVPVVGIIEKGFVLHKP